MSTKIIRKTTNPTMTSTATTTIASSSLPFKTSPRWRPGTGARDRARGPFCSWARRYERAGVERHLRWVEPEVETRYSVLLCSGTQRHGVPSEGARKHDGRPDGDAEGHARRLRAGDHRQRGDLRVRHHPPPERSSASPTSSRGPSTPSCMRLEKNRLGPGDEAAVREWGRRAKFYALNEAGRAELATFWAKWEYVTSRIDKLKEVGDEPLGRHDRNDLNREWQAFDARAKALPADYRGGQEHIVVHLFPYGNFSGRNLMPILDGALGLLEETAADGRSDRGGAG